jgi:hypothetical protein
MLTALLAAKNILGENHGLWDVNMERSGHENFTYEEWTKLLRTAVNQPKNAQPLSTVV